MTRDDYIEFEANSYGNMIAGGSTMNTPITLAFKQGVLFADHHPKCPWISVKDDLPCNHKELIHSNYTDRVLTMSRYGYTEVAFMSKMEEDAWEWSNLFVVKYWMPIPEMPED